MVKVKSKKQEVTEDILLKYAETDRQRDAVKAWYKHDFDKELARAELNVNESAFRNLISRVKSKAAEHGYAPGDSSAAKGIKDPVARARIVQLEKLVERQAQQLEAARAPKFQLPVGGKPDKSGSGAFCRVIIPDSHGCFIDPDACTSFLHDLESIRPAEVIMLGDHLDCGGFLAQHQTLGFVAESDYSYAEDVAACNQFLDAIQSRAPGASVDYLEGNHECVTPEHEVLTVDGWKPIAEITKADIVASMNDQGETVWSNPLAVHSYDYDGDLVCLEGVSARIEMTPEHRVWYWSQNDRDLICRKAKNILGTTTTYRLPVASQNKNGELVRIEDDWLKLLGWILTDGTLSSNKVCIYQSKPNGVSKIQAILDALNIEYTKTTRDRESSFGGTALLAHCFAIKAESRRVVLAKLWGVESCERSTKQIPSWVGQLSSRQFRIFLEAVLDGDGTRRGTASCLYGERTFLDEMQSLLVVNGYSCSLARRHRSTGGWYDCLNIKERTTHKVDGSSFFSKHYSGTVHCLTTITDNFYIRLRGRVSVTGNSRIEKWIVTQTLRNKRDAEMLHQLFGVESSLSLQKRGIRHYKQGVFYDGLPIPATIRRGHCHFTHGIYTSKSAAAAHLAKYGGNVVFGHTHRADSATARTVKAGVIGAWNPGCLCMLQRLWNHTALTDWSHGYGLQVVQGDDFLHINVPIINGHSYLQPLAATLGGK